MIPALAIFFVTLLIKLNYDVWLYKSGKRNQHLRGAVIVFLVLVGCTWNAGWLSAGIWFFGWWALFDTAYAILIGQKWYFTGNTPQLDKLQAKYPVLKWIKYAGLPASIILFICLK
jgi:hypothetical protein